MSLRILCRKTVVALICLTVGLLSALPFGATSEAGDSFSILEFEPAYTFPLTVENVVSDENSLLSSSGKTFTVSSSGSGYEEVTLSIVSENNFDSSLLGKEQATLHLNLIINDINGFLDSSGNFRGGTVTLSLPDIEYKWSLDGIKISQGATKLHLNLRTAEKIYPEGAISEDDLFFDTEEEEAEVAISCTLSISLKKLPSVQNASFSIDSAAIEMITLPPQVDSKPLEQISTEDNSVWITVSVCLGVATVLTIVISVSVVTAKEEEKQRRRRKKKRAKAKLSERNGENEL